MSIINKTLFDCHLWIFTSIWDFGQSVKNLPINRKLKGETKNKYPIIILVIQILEHLRSHIHLYLVSSLFNSLIILFQNLFNQGFLYLQFEASKWAFLRPVSLYKFLKALLKAYLWSIQNSIFGNLNNMSSGLKIDVTPLS